MSVLIKGMKMPNGCHLCPFANEYDECCINAFLEDQHEITHYCHLIHIPDHGDLVDRDKFIGRLQSWALLIAMGHGDGDEWVKCIGEVCDHLYDEPVVIPAERSEK